MFRPLPAAAALAAAFLLVPPPGAARADFIIDINYAGDAQFRPFFDNAARQWESLLSGYQNGTVVARSQNSSYQAGETVQTLFIDANVSFIDGAGGVLGSAGPNELIIDQAGFFLATDGGMTFDSADSANLVAAGTFEAVVLHEMAHVMGFGTLWTQNNVYINNTGEYLGANGNAAWNTEFGQPGTSDVELAGGPGTANGHWNEVDGGTGLTGITVQDPNSANFGRDMRDELMTGWLNANPFISDMTIGSFVDIGFVAAAVPEPGTVLLIAFGAAGAFAVRRRAAA